MKIKNGCPHITKLPLLRAPMSISEDKEARGSAWS